MLSLIYPNNLFYPLIPISDSSFPLLPPPLPSTPQSLIWLLRSSVEKLTQSIHVKQRSVRLKHLNYYASSYLNMSTKTCIYSWTWLMCIWRGREKVIYNAELLTNEIWIMYHIFLLKGQFSMWKIFKQQRYSKIKYCFELAPALKKSFSSYTSLCKCINKFREFSLWLKPTHIYCTL